MRFFILILISLFLIREVSAVKDLPILNDGEWFVFQDLTRKNPKHLEDASTLSSLKIRGVMFSTEMLRAGEARVYESYAKASSFNALEDLWRYNNPRYHSGEPINDNIILINQAFGIIRLAGIFALEGYKPSDENLVSWRNFLLTKLRGISGRDLESQHKKHLDKWSLFQRHARTYIPLIFSDLGENGLHEAHENKRELFQKAWDAFGEAEKLSQSKRLPLFKLGLLVLKDFMPEGYNEDLKKTETEQLEGRYNKVSARSEAQSFMARRASHPSDIEMRAVREIGPGTERERHTKGGIFGSALREKILDALMKLRSNNSAENDEGHQDPHINPGGDDDNGEGGHGYGGGSGGGAEDLDDDSGGGEKDRQYTGEEMTLSQNGAQRDVSGSSTAEDSPFTPRSSLGLSLSSTPISDPRFRCSTISFDDYLIRRGQESLVLHGSQNSETGLKMQGLEEGHLHDPLATSTSFQEKFYLDRSDESGYQQNDTVPGVDALQPLEGMRMDQDDEEAVSQTLERSRSPLFSGAARAEDPDEDEEEDKDKDKDKEESEDKCLGADEDASEEEASEEVSPSKRKKLNRFYSRYNPTPLATYLKKHDVHYKEQIPLWIRAAKKAQKELSTREIAMRIASEAEIDITGETRFDNILRFFEIHNIKNDSLRSNVFTQHLNDNEDSYKKRISVWIADAKRTQKELLTRDIAERIVLEGGLDLKVEELQLENVKRFLKRVGIVNDTKKITATDILKCQEEEIIKRIFERFHEKFVQELSQNIRKKKEYVPLLRKELEEFASQHSHGQKIEFMNEKTAQHFIYNHLKDFGITLPGQHTKSTMTSFLRDDEHTSFIRSLMLKLAPKWNSTSLKAAVVAEFEKEVSALQKSQHRFVTPHAGEKRLYVLYARHIIESSAGTYVLQPEKKRKP